MKRRDKDKGWAGLGLRNQVEEGEGLELGGG